MEVADTVDELLASYLEYLVLPGRDETRDVELPSPVVAPMMGASSLLLTPELDCYSDLPWEHGSGAGDAGRSPGLVASRCWGDLIEAAPRTGRWGSRPRCWESTWTSRRPTARPPSGGLPPRLPLSSRRGEGGILTTSSPSSGAPTTTSTTSLVGLLLTTPWQSRVGHTRSLLKTAMVSLKLKMKKKKKKKMMMMMMMCLHKKVIKSSSVLKTAWDGTTPLPLTLALLSIMPRPSSSPLSQGETPKPRPALVERPARR